MGAGKPVSATGSRFSGRYTVGDIAATQRHSPCRALAGECPLITRRHLYLRTWVLSQPMASKRYLRRRIVVCVDGTWFDEDGREGRHPSAMQEHRTDRSPPFILKDAAGATTATYSVCGLR